MSSPGLLQQVQLMEQVSMAVAKKSLDAAEQQGAAAISLLESAAEVSQAAAKTSGKHIDVYG